MKRLSELTAADLERAPVWRYEGSSDDVALVRATELREIAADAPDVFIARTQFVLANGAQFSGFCTPTDDTELEFVQPVIVAPRGLVYFWFEQPPSEESLQEQWRRLDAGHEEIFPIHYRCTVPVDGHFITGVIESADLTGAA